MVSVHTGFSAFLSVPRQQAEVNTHGNSDVNKKEEHLTHANCFSPLPVGGFIRKQKKINSLRLYLELLSYECILT